MRSCRCCCHRRGRKAELKNWEKFRITLRQNGFRCRFFSAKKFSHSSRYLFSFSFSSERICVRFCYGLILRTDSSTNHKIRIIRNNFYYENHKLEIFNRKTKRLQNLIVALGGYRYHIFTSGRSQRDLFWSIFCRLKHSQEFDFGMFLRINILDNSN